MAVILSCPIIELHISYSYSQL